MTDHDIPDSTDWLSTPLSGFAAVESALRCEVCKDFYKTPMITSCSHTFCSLCIRRALSSDGKCPLCRTSDQQLKLRSNWAMEETVDAFTKARTDAMALARSRGEEKSASKRKAEPDTVETNDGPGSKRLRTSARLRKSQVEAPPVDPVEIEDEEEEVVQEVVDEDEYVPDDGLVPCPACQTRMKEWQVFSHLESCTGPAPPKPKVVAAPAFSQRQAHQTKASERLPGLNYSMLKENALRKKLAELGISNQGPRVLLERRHKEWLTIWNANCDSARPRKRSELVHDLDVWERTQGGRVPTMGRLAQNEPMVKDKEFDGAAWGAKHSSSFQDLIANAMKSKMEAKKKTEESSKEPDEAEAPNTSAGPETSDTQTSVPPATTDTNNFAPLQEPNNPPAPAGPAQVPSIPPAPVAHHPSQHLRQSNPVIADRPVPQEHGATQGVQLFVYETPTQPIASDPPPGTSYQQLETPNSGDWYGYPTYSSHLNRQSHDQVNHGWSDTPHQHVTHYQRPGEMLPSSSDSGSGASHHHNHHPQSGQ